MLTYAEFKRLDIFKTANSIELINENGIKIDNILDEELNGMDVTGYFIKNGHLTVEISESIAEFV